VLVSRSDSDKIASALSRLANGELAIGEGDAADSQVSGPEMEMGLGPASNAGVLEEAEELETAAPAERAARPAVPTIAPPPMPVPILAVPVAEVLQDEPTAGEQNGDIADAGATEDSPDSALQTEPLVSEDGVADPAGTPANPFEPAPVVEVYRPAASGARHRTAAYQTLEFRRTIIPVLLVCGCLLIALATAAYLVSPTSPLSALPGWMPPVLIVFGAALLVMAVLNMLSVKQAMER
jgi:hypothetical protein